MGAMVSQITSLAIVYLTVYSGAEQRKHQSSASLAFVRGIHWWPVNSPHKGSVTRKMFPFDDVILLHVSRGFITKLGEYFFPRQWQKYGKNKEYQKTKKSFIKLHPQVCQALQRAYQHLICQHFCKHFKTLSLSFIFMLRVWPSVMTKVGLKIHASWHLSIKSQVSLTSIGCLTMIFFEMIYCFSYTSTGINADASKGKTRPGYFDSKLV